MRLHTRDDGALEFTAAQVLVIGASGMGKTWGTLAPSVTAAEAGPMVVSSTAPDLFDACAAPLAAAGRPVWVWNPDGRFPVPDWARPVTWSPITADYAQALRRADLLFRTASLVRSLDLHFGGEHPYFAARGAQLFGVLLAAARSVSELYEWIATLGTDRQAIEASALMKGETMPDVVHEVAATLDGLALTAPEEASGVWNSAGRALEPYRDPHARRHADDPRYSITAGEFLDAAPAVFVVADDTTAMWAPLLCAFISEVWQEVRARRQPDGPGVALFLDEFTTMSPLPARLVQSLLAEGRKWRVSMCAAVQDPALLRRIYGESVWNLFPGKVVFAVQDRHTQELVAAEFGERTVFDTSRARQLRTPVFPSAGRYQYGLFDTDHSGGPSTVSRSPRQERAMWPHDVGRLAPGEAIVLDLGRAPRRVRALRRTPPV